MFPIYFVVGLINLLAQQKNYGIQIQDPNFDIRVRRSIPGSTQELFNQHTIENSGITREKRYAYYKKTKINNNYYNGNNNLINTGSYENQGYNEPRNNYNEPRNTYNGSSNLRYNIFNPNYNIPFNNTRRNNTNNISINNGNIRPYIRSYPYGYPPGYGPNTTPGYNPTGYNQNIVNTPQFYNYQNPNGNNFAGFYGYSSNTPGYNRIVAGYNVPLPYTPNNTPRINNRPWETQLAPFPTTPTPNVEINTAINNNNNRFQPTYNNFNNIPTPYGQNNNSGNYTPFNTTQNSGINTPTLPNTYDTNNFNNTFVDNTVGNISVTNSTVTTTEKIVTSCVICNIPCPAFMKRFGRFCISEDEEE